MPLRLRRAETRSSRSIPASRRCYRIERGTLRHGAVGLVPPRVAGREHVPDDRAGHLGPGPPLLRRLLFAAFVHRPQALLHGQGRAVEAQGARALLLTVGAFPVHRESADREALQRAEEVLRRGQVLVLFPEGTRQEGPVIERPDGGGAFLSARTGAPIVPIGIGGSDLAMPKGTRIPKPLRIEVVVGRAIPPPPRTGGGRVSRSAVHAATEALGRSSKPSTTRPAPKAAAGPRRGSRRASRPRGR